MKVNSSFVLRNIYEKYILMPICANSASNDPILLNNVAASIWEMASYHQERAGLLAGIAQEYELTQDSVELNAVDNFISQMVDIGLLSEDGEEK